MRVRHIAGSTAYLPVGLGDASDLAAIIADNPDAKTAWDDVVKQIGAEGGDQYGAQKAFTDAYNGIITSAGIDPKTAAEAARELVLTGKTVAGAVKNINGLANAAKNPAALVPQVTSLFTGTLVGIATSSGALTAGAGAAITLGVSAIVGLLQQAGFFGSAPQGVSFCGATVNPAPTMTVGCIIATPIGNAPWSSAPNSPGWRPFPNPSNQDDAVWFTQSPGRTSDQGKSFAWRDVNWYPIWNRRPIDSAFDAYHQLECEQAQSYALPGISLKDIGLLRGAAVVAFLSAFFSAWKANKEWELNGLQSRADEDVLLHVARIWNYAHEPGDGFDFSPSSAQPLADFQDCSEVRDTYVSQLVQKAAAHGGPDITSDGKLHINTGNQKTTSFAVRAPGLALAKNLALSIEGKPTSFTTKVVASSAVVGSAALASVWWYGKKRGLSIGQASRQLTQSRRNKYILAGAATATAATILAVAKITQPKAPAAGTPSVASSTAMSTGTKVLIGVGLVAITSTGLLWWYASKRQLTMGQAVRGLLPHRRGARENPFFPPENEFPSLRRRTPPVVKPRKSLPKRRVAFRARLDVSPDFEAVILFQDNTAIFYRYGRPVVRFRPLPYQFRKIRNGVGDLQIFADQIIESLVGRS